MTFTAVVPRHVGIMKTPESDSTKKLILAISTNTCRYICVFFYQKEDILILSILKNELNGVDFCRFTSIYISASPPPVHHISDLQNNLSLHIQNMDHIFCRVNTTSLYLHLNN